MLLEILNVITLLGVNAAVGTIAQWMLPMRRPGLFMALTVGVVPIFAFVLASPTTMNVWNIVGFIGNYILLPSLFWTGPYWQRFICGFLILFLQFTLEVCFGIVFVFAGWELSRDAMSIEVLAIRIVNIGGMLIGGRILAYLARRVFRPTGAPGTPEQTEHAVRPRPYLIFFFTQCIFVAQATFLLMTYRKALPIVYAVVLVLIVICLVCDAVALTSLKRFNRAEAARARADALEDQLAVYISGARSTAHEAERAARFRHDQRNHLQVLRGLVSQGDTERARSYVATLRHTLSQPACDTLEDEREVSARE